MQSRLEIDNRRYVYADLSKALGSELSALPWVLRILAENSLRREAAEPAADDGSLDGGQLSLG